jgi:hypothetical protein
MIQPGNAADIDADFSKIRHRIYIQAGADRADVQGRSAQIGMRRDVELENLQRCEHARRLVGGIDAEMRHRSMRGDALQRQAKPERALVSDQCRIRGGLRHDDRGGRPDNAGARQMKCTLAADFLARGDGKNGPCGALQLSGHVTDCRNERCDPAFHVSRAAAVDLAVDDLAGKRIDAPGRVAKRNRIDMAGEAQLRLASGASNPGDQIGAIRSEILQRGLQPGGG